MAVMLVRWKLLPAGGKYLLCMILALSLGTMPAMNSWDGMVYAGVYLVLAAVIWLSIQRTSDPVSGEDVQTFMPDSHLYIELRQQRSVTLPVEPLMSDDG